MVVVGAVLLTLVSGGAKTLLIMATSDMLTSAHANLNGFAAIVVLNFALQAAAVSLQEYICARRKAEMSARLVRLLDAAPLEVIETVRVSVLTTILRTDIPLIASLQVKLLRGMASAVTAVCAFAYLAWIAPRLLATGVTILLAFALSALAVVSGRDVTRRAHLACQEWLALHNHTILGAKELRLSAERNEALVRGRLVRASREFFRLEGFAGFLQSLADAITQLILFAALGAAAYLAYRSGLQTAEIVAFGVVFMYLATSVQDSIPIVLFALQKPIAEKRLLDLEAQLAEFQPEAPSTAGAIPDDWDEISTEQLLFSRRGENFVLGPIDVTVRRNTIVFVVGGNGSGKTTFLKALSGLYPLTGGSVWLGDTKIVAANRAAYRQRFAGVFFDFHLFDGELLPTEPDLVERGNDYLRLLELDSLVELASGKFSSVALSQGQRRRLALVAAYLEDRDIYVFDEWAADQDPQFKTVFYRRLLPELKARGKTVIVVTHDDRYFDVADQLVKLENGRPTGDSTEQFMIRLGAVAQPGKR